MLTFFVMYIPNLVKCDDNLLSQPCTYPASNLLGLVMYMGGDVCDFVSKADSLKFDVGVVRSL